MAAHVINVEGLSKRYHIGALQRKKTFREAIGDAVATPLRRVWRFGRSSHRIADSIWALKNVSFEVGRAEVLGVIGPNGAGKTTLLEILSRITEPTEGVATIRGRIGSLLGIGTGFHGELTGRENTYLSGAILGMKKKEINRKFDQIVEFAGVEAFIDTPVKRYSSGMMVRLGFAIAAHLSPEVLLIDEVLAVGDAEFQKKCLGKMEGIARSGRTVVFVSHNMDAVSRLCDRGLVLSAGRGVYCGDVNEAIMHYLRPSGGIGEGLADLTNAQRATRNGQKILTRISTHQEDGKRSYCFQTGSSMEIRVGYRLEAPLPNAYCGLHFLDCQKRRIMSLISQNGATSLTLKGEGVIRCAFEDLRLVSGEYTIEVEIGQATPFYNVLDYVPEAIRVQVQLRDYLGRHYTRPSRELIAQRARWYP